MMIKNDLPDAPWIRNDLPDAPWIREAETDGVGRDEDEFDRSDRASFLRKADQEFGWKVLAWRLDVRERDVQDPDDWQTVWKKLAKEARLMYCESLRRIDEEKARKWYNESFRVHNQED